MQGACSRAETKHDPVHTYGRALCLLTSTASAALSWRTAQQSTTSIYSGMPVTLDWDAVAVPSNSRNLSCAATAAQGHVAKHVHLAMQSTIRDQTREQPVRRCSTFGSVGTLRGLSCGDWCGQGRAGLQAGNNCCCCCVHITGSAGDGKGFS